MFENLAQSLCVLPKKAVSYATLQDCFRRVPSEKPIRRNCSYHDKNTLMQESPDFIINGLSELSKITNLSWSITTVPNPRTQS
jgi:hypothetical protein